MNIQVWLQTRITEAIWSWARKISADDCNLTDLKAPMLPQFLASLPLGWSLKNFTLDEISTSIHSRILDENFQTKSFIKNDFQRR